MIGVAACAIWAVSGAMAAEPNQANGVSASSAPVSVVAKTSSAPVEEGTLLEFLGTIMEPAAVALDQPKTASQKGDLALEQSDAPVLKDNTLVVEPASQSIHYSGANDRMRATIAPNYSEDLGWSLKGAVGLHVVDEVAIGAIVEYGENKREYLANAGVQFTDEVSLVGTVGMLEEHNEYVDGEDRVEVRQMEYGASLKGAYELGILGGFELNGYLADADSDSDSVEVGKLYGVQLLADLDLTDTTHVKVGGGYEWLEWEDTNEDDSSFAASAEVAQQLGDMLTLTGQAKMGASEYVYGGGLALDLSNGGLNTNMLGVNYIYIDGRNGIEDDQRVELSWSYGFGAGPSTNVAAAQLTDSTGTIRATSDAVAAPANSLLNDVMKRPAYLPQRVLARKASTGDAPGPVCNVVAAYAGYDFGGGIVTDDRIEIGGNVVAQQAQYTFYLVNGDGTALGPFDVVYAPDDQNATVFYFPDFWSAGQSIEVFKNDVSCGAVQAVSDGPAPPV